MEALTVETVLVGVDGGEASMVAVDHAVAIASRYDAELAILFVLDGTDHRALEAGDADPAELSATAQAFLSEAEAAAAEVDVPARTATAYGYSTRRKLVHPGSVVLDAAEDLATDFIVLPRDPIESHGSEAGTLAKAAEYALLYASQPILAV